MTSGFTKAAAAGMDEKEDISQPDAARALLQKVPANQLNDQEFERLASMTGETIRNISAEVGKNCSGLMVAMQECNNRENDGTVTPECEQAIVAANFCAAKVICPYVGFPRNKSRTPHFLLESISSSSSFNTVCVNPKTVPCVFVCCISFSSLLLHTQCSSRYLYETDDPWRRGRSGKIRTDDKLPRPFPSHGKTCISSRAWRSEIGSGKIRGKTTGSRIFNSVRKASSFGSKIPNFFFFLVSGFGYWKETKGAIFFFALVGSVWLLCSPSNLVPPRANCFLLVLFVIVVVLLSTILCPPFLPLLIGSNAVLLAIAYESSLSQELLFLFTSGLLCLFS